MATGISAVSDLDGRFALSASPGVVRVKCYSATLAFAPGTVDMDLRDGAAATIRVIAARSDALDTGVTFTTEPDGARIVGVARRARRAGLRPGDQVRAVNGISLAGLSGAAMFALAFEFSPREQVRWTLERDGRLLTIIAPPW
jgi:predicted metalloprotease with PDZ domain